MPKILLILIVFLLLLLSPQVSFANTEIPLGFTSQEQHSDSLLDYNARYYDTDLAHLLHPHLVDFRLTIVYNMSITIL